MVPIERLVATDQANLLWSLEVTLERNRKHSVVLGPDV